MPFFRQESRERTFEGMARRFADALRAEPAAADVEWLTSAATRGDADHAIWELRYARRALGILVAQRDALDDRTGSAVARLVTDALARDPAVDPRMTDVAIAQFNARLSAYRDVLQNRAGAPVTTRLGQMLLAFAGGPIGRQQAEVARAGEILGAYLAETAAELQATFGRPELPDDVPPSAVFRPR